MSITCSINLAGGFYGLKGRIPFEILSGSPLNSSYRARMYIPGSMGRGNIRDKYFVFVLSCRRLTEGLRSINIRARTYAMRVEIPMS